MSKNTDNLPVAPKQAEYAKGMCEFVDEPTENCMEAATEWYGGMKGAFE